MTKKLHKELTRWQDVTFTKATPASCIAHLREELDELDESMDSHYNFDIDEWADCYMLLIGVANTGKFSFEDCKAAIKYKLDENKKREWGEPNEKGYVKHLPYLDDFCNAYGYPAEMLYQEDMKPVSYIFVVKNKLLDKIEYMEFSKFGELVYDHPEYYIGPSEFDILRVFKIYKQNGRSRYSRNRS